MADVQNSEVGPTLKLSVD